MLVALCVGVSLYAGCAQTGAGSDHEVGLNQQALGTQVQKASATTLTSIFSTSVTATLPSTPTAGNLLVAVAGSPSSSTHNNPSGWSIALSSTSSSPYQITYYKVAGASESKSVTINGLSLLAAYWGLQVFEFSGLDGKNAPSAVDTTTSLSLGNKDFSSGSVTTAAPGGLVLVAGTQNGLPLTLAGFGSWTNGFTELFDFGSLENGFTSAYRVASAAGSFATGATATGLGTLRTHTLAFNPLPTPVTNLAVSAGVNTNQLTFVAPSVLLTHVLVLAKTSDCSFSGTPSGSESKGATVGNAVVIFNDALGADLGPVNVTVAASSTTVTYDSSTGVLTHGSLTSGTTYCYKAFARNGLALDDNSARPTRSGTPLSGALSDPEFVLSAASTSLSATSILPGTGAYYADNAGKLLSCGSAGTRLFAPYQLPDAVQSRGPAGTLTGDADSTLFVSSLDGDAYAIWASGASKGTLRWSTAGIDGDDTTAGDQALGLNLYAAPLVSNSLSRVFVGTRNLSTSQNRVFALDAQTGSCMWVFNGGCDGSTTALNVGQISSVPVLDPVNYRLLFTTTQLNGGSTLWAVDAHDSPGTRLLWSRDIGASNSSPSFNGVKRSALMVGTNAGLIYYLDPASGVSCWGSTGDGCGGAATGSEQFFCTNPSVDARATSCTGGSAVQKGIVYLSTPYSGSFIVTTADGNLRMINASGVQQWRTNVSGASAPLVLQGVGSGYIYVGGNDGLVHELALPTGTESATRNVGGGSVVVGDPAYDGVAGQLYVSTSSGNLYAFNVPL